MAVAAAKKELESTESREPALEQGETKAGVGLHTAANALVVIIMLIGKLCHVAEGHHQCGHLNNG